MLIKVPVSWLREYVDISVPIDELAMRLHMSSTEVKGVERPWWDDKVRVGRISKLAKHPNADKLQLATVEYGEDRPKTVVTGATNLTVGDIVPFADEGAQIIDGHTGERTTLRGKPMRGIQSEGMVLSAKELGQGEDHDGIQVLDRKLPVGARLRDVLGQPLHAYDHRKLRGGLLVARRARRGETLRTLDGVERVLHDDTLVIADADRALGVAGILGGEDSEIREDTTTVALECASFEPRGIGRTAANLGLHGSAGSAAARRLSLERSPHLVSVPLPRALPLLPEHAGGEGSRVLGR